MGRGAATAPALGAAGTGKDMGKGRGTLLHEKKTRPPLLVLTLMSRRKRTRTRTTALPPLRHFPYHYYHYYSHPPGLTTPSCC
jgi:hypothetical protein